MPRRGIRERLRGCVLIAVLPTAACAAGLDAPVARAQQGAVTECGDLDRGVGVKKLTTRRVSCRRARRIARTHRPCSRARRHALWLPLPGAGDRAVRVRYPAYARCSCRAVAVRERLALGGRLACAGTATRSVRRSSPFSSRPAAGSDVGSRGITVTIAVPIVRADADPTSTPECTSVSYAHRPPEAETPGAASARFCSCAGCAFKPRTAR